MPIWEPSRQKCTLSCLLLSWRSSLSLSHGRAVHMVHAQTTSLVSSIQISRGGMAPRALTRQRLSRPWVLKNNHWSPGVAQEHARKRLSSLGVEQCEPEFGDCSWTENIFFPVGQRAPIQEPCAFRSGTPCTRPQSQCHSVGVVFPCGILWCWEQEIATWSHFWSLTFPPCCTTRFRTLRLAAGSEVLFPRKVNGTTLWKQDAALIFSSCASGIDSSAPRGRFSLGVQNQTVVRCVLVNRNGIFVSSGQVQDEELHDFSRWKAASWNQTAACTGSGSICDG